MDTSEVSVDFVGMADGLGEIPVRNERQAMDWSLVLASQGIEASIEHLPESGQWLLRVSEEERHLARQAIRLYLIENRNRRWRQEWQLTGLLFDWRCLFWCLYLGLMFYLEEVLPVDLRLAGRMDTSAVADGEWFRLLTATTLHADAGHLAANLTMGLILVGLAMGAYGAGQALAAVFFAGAFGNLVVQFLHGSPHLSLGASGAVMGALGLLSVHSLLQRTVGGSRYWLWRGLFAGLLALVLFGFSPGTDVLAHVGGFVGGVLAGWLLSLASHKGQPRTHWDGVLAWLVGVTVSLAWALALCHP